MRNVLVKLMALVLISGAGQSAESAASLPQAVVARPLALMTAVSWYPEQWPEGRWDQDLAMMQAAHIGFVRIAEFSWSSIEPREGDFKLDWLDRAIRAAGRRGIKVVLGTPTAAPPAWLTTAYPQVFRTRANGMRDTHGGRHQADNFNPQFRLLAAQVVTRMAQRFGHDPDVIGWQIDNEPGGDDFSPDTRTQFQAWLKQRYGTLDQLNARWTTAYWSQTYSDWSQIPLPTGDGNPGLMLAWRLFLTDANRAYLRDQRDIIRANATPSQRITTNLWIDARAKTPATYVADVDDLDLHTLNADLDFASWDEYTGANHLDPARFGVTHDIVRGLLGRNFWVMETQPGTVNWADNNISLDRGEVRALAWHAVAHGADAVAYWQWRSALGGQEQYHGVIVGADGSPVPVYDEISRIGAEFARAAPALAGTTVVSPVAVLNDYPSRWAIGWQRFAEGFIPANVLYDYYLPLRTISRSVDVVADTAPLGRYKLVIAPALNLLTQAAGDNLIAYVQGGGNLVLGARSGLKDGDNALSPARQPGALAALVGARVALWYALDRPVAVAGRWGQGEATTWAERLEITVPDAEVTLRYGAANGWLDEQPAAVTRRIGLGSITYVGANLDPKLTATIVRQLTAASGVVPVLPGLPDGVDVGVREGGGRQVVILSNYAEAPRRVELPRMMDDVLAGGHTGSVLLPRYGVAVLETRIDAHAAKAETGLR